MSQRPEVVVVPVKQAVAEFLGQKRIAVTGVSRSGSDHGANVVYKRLKERGYEVFPINPHAEQVEGDRAYADLKSVAGGVDAVVIGTSPAHAEETVREHGMTVIDGGCPCMFAPTADIGHKVMHFLGIGHMPRQV